MVLGMINARVLGTFTVLSKSIDITLRLESVELAWILADTIREVSERWGDPRFQMFSICVYWGRSMTVESRSKNAGPAPACYSIR